MDNPTLIHNLLSVKELFPHLTWTTVSNGYGDPELQISVKITDENQDFLIAAQKMFEPADTYNSSF